MYIYYMYLYVYIYISYIYICIIARNLQAHYKNVTPTLTKIIAIKNEGWCPCFSTIISTLFDFMIFQDFRKKKLYENEGTHKLQ